MQPGSVTDSRRRGVGEVQTGMPPLKPPRDQCQIDDGREACPLQCRFNRFARDDLAIWSWELRCTDCGYRETVAYRSDDEEPLDSDPEICPFCLVDGWQPGRNPCTEKTS